MNLLNTYSNAADYSGIYRGYVVENADPLRKGRVKVFIPGIYPEKYSNHSELLPWAMPASPMFGGSSLNKKGLNDAVGICSVPHKGNAETGAQVFVFFENSDINYPIYFSADQGGNAWFSKHENQHCIRTDNVKICIDEDFNNSKSNKTSTYTENQSLLAKESLSRTANKNRHNGSIFNNDLGIIDNLKTRVDIEVEAKEGTAINLNIHGNVNVNVEGDMYTSQIGNRYDYQKGDRFIKIDGNTYIEQAGVVKEVLNGSKTFDHIGHYVENHTGDALISRSGELTEIVNKNVTKIYNQNVRMNVNKSLYENVGSDFTFNVGNDAFINIVGNNISNTAGTFEFKTDKDLKFSAKDDVKFISNEGNIVLKTEGKFELMENDIITNDGFNNLGKKGNIQFISTFGNINMQCVKNDKLANFIKKNVVVPWNPRFLERVKSSFKNFDIEAAITSGMCFNPNVSSYEDFTKLMDSIYETGIYDGLPVFLPTQMIVQNPNYTIPNSINDDEWIKTFRSEPADWRSISNDVMWKIPGRLIGNINIETWSGDINIKTESSLGCAGNVNITACENTGTIAGYKIGTINLKGYGKNKVYPDPRDLFLDSAFDDRTKLFVTGTTSNISNSSNISSIKFDPTAFKMNSPEIMIGCPKCISDYIVTCAQRITPFYKNENLLDLPYGYHEFGNLHVNPITNEMRSIINFDAEDFENLSNGDGHAIDIGFIDKSFAGKNIGGFTINSNGDYSVIIGKNAIKKFNNDSSRKNGTFIERHEFIDNKFDVLFTSDLNSSIEQRSELFENNFENIISIDEGTMKLGGSNSSNPKSIGTSGLLLSMFDDVRPKNAGYYSINQTVLGNDSVKTEIIDKRYVENSGYEIAKLASSLSNVSLNGGFYENNLYINETINNAVKTKVSGGSQQWIILNKNNNSLYIEAEAVTDSFKIETIDASNNYTDTISYNNSVHAWWDQKDFENDLVPDFPDILFSVNGELNKSFINLVNDENASFSNNISIESYTKYGNHVTGGKHENYTELDDTEFILAKNKNDNNITLVNNSEKLWDAKLSNGITILSLNNKIANVISNNFSDFNKPSNAEIINMSKSISIGDIKDAKLQTANGSNESIETYDSELNSKVITYAAARNEHTLILDSNRVSLVNSNKKGIDYELIAGNIFKTILKGNDKYYNYDLPKELEDAKITHGEYSNNIEFSQNGFLTNNIKLINGTNTRYGNDSKEGKYGVWVNGKNPDSILKNEISILNGGENETDTPYADEPTAYKQVEKTSNIFNMLNGVSNVGVSGDNEINVKNGIGTFKGLNLIGFDNGSSLRDGSNVFRIANTSMDSSIGEMTINEISLDNNNGKEKFILSDSLSGSLNKTTKKHEYSSTSKAILVSNDKMEFMNGNDLKFISNNIDVESLKFTTNSNVFDIITISSCFNSQIFDINTKNYRLIGNDQRMIGNSINIDGTNVMMAFANISGEFYGNAKGSFIGSVGNEDGILYMHPSNDDIVKDAKHGVIMVSDGLTPLNLEDSHNAYPRVPIKSRQGIIETVANKFKNVFKKIVDIELKLIK